MIRTISTKSLVACAIALGAVVAGTAAHAGTNVTLVVGQNAPHRYVQPAPVVAQLQTVQYRQQRDRFDRFDRRGPMGDADRDGIPNRFDRDSRLFDARATQRHAQWSDFDRDGVPDRFDRAPRNPHRY
jgi:hypothetical protein